MNRFLTILSLSALLFASCGGTDNNHEDFGSNPFLEGLENGKEDTGYVNLRGVEVHVTLESDIQVSSSWRIFDAPADLAQFAVTYLRKRDSFYMELLAEDTTTPDRVEWLVDGEWLTHEQASQIDRSKLTHFRMQDVNAVVMGYQADQIEVGKTFEAPVPIKPDSIMADAGDKCVDADAHLGLSQSIYWYLWNPKHSGCQQELLQTMTLTVTEVLPDNPDSYPEYDKLWEDGKLTAAVFFGKLDDGDVADDCNWDNVKKLGDWLIEAGFTESSDAPMGKRYMKSSGELSVIIDIYGPDVFNSVADYSRFGNWQRAVSEHEIVMYNGHSVLGTGYAFEQADYPDFYQIFQIASCLSYEYYVRPVLAGKGDWTNVDVISNLTPTYYSENFPLTTTVLAKLVWGFENQGRASWQDIMEAVSHKLGHARFGVSGARGNCYSPSGNLCNTDPDPDPDPVEKSYTNGDRVDIPDNQPEGIVSTIVVPDDFKVGSLQVELDINHTYVGDLEVVLSHAGRSYTLWDRAGGSAENIQDTFSAAGFNQLEAAGEWTLTISDNAGADVGRLNSWTLVFSADDGNNPDPGDELRYEDAAGTPIPDNDSGGISRTMSVPDSVTIAALKVELNVKHTYVGDLQIELQHNGTSYALWDRSGGGADDIHQTFDVTTFAGQDASGDWTLAISDRAYLDKGTLDSWALVITPAE